MDTFCCPRHMRHRSAVAKRRRISPVMPPTIRTPSGHAPRGPIKAKPLHQPTYRCTAHSARTGQPCKRPPIRGGTVCATHGGSAPQVRRAATRRIEELRPAAIQYYDWLLEQRDFPSAGLGAANAVMDRVDGRPAETMRVVAMTEAALQLLDEGRARNATRRGNK